MSKKHRLRANSSSPQQPSNPPPQPTNPPHRPGCIRIAIIIPLAVFVILLIASHFLVPIYLYKQSYWRQEDSPGIVSDVFHSPESFARDYERMERDLKVYIYRDRDPGEHFQLPSKLTGMYGSEANFFKNIRENRFLTTDPLQSHLFFIPLYWHKMRSQEI